MSAFVMAVETGSFSAAARDLGLTPSALSKLVTRLEDRLGARLLQRTTRRLQLTLEGETFFNRVRPILTAMAEAEAEVTESSATPRGVLRLHCGFGFAMHQLAPALPRFIQRYPNIELDIVINDQPPSLVEDNIDLAIRIGTVEGLSLVARHVCNLERVICAAPAYLARRGTPAHPDELLQHECLWISGLPELRRWPFDTDEGIRVVHIGGNVLANNAEMVLQLVLAGVGIARLPDVMVGEAMRRGELAPILKNWHHVEPVPLYATYPSARHLPPKVRAMVDFLVDEFKNRPWTQFKPQ